MSKLFGRGLLYIFVGIYYLNVVSGGVEGTCAGIASLVPLPTAATIAADEDGAIVVAIGSCV